MDQVSNCGYINKINLVKIFGVYLCAYALNMLTRPRSQVVNYEYYTNNHKIMVLGS
jgi:hypothetical protein